jgi:hypothetical protein
MDDPVDKRRIELAERTNAGVEVTLQWLPGTDKTIVCVCDQGDGAYFEIPVEPYVALDVYYHPFAYRHVSSVDFKDERLAA